MKKIISILLSAAILISALAIGFTVSAAEEELKIAVASDLHYNIPREELEHDIDHDIYWYANRRAAMEDESGFIIDEMLRQVAEDDNCEYLLISGDLVDNGRTIREEHIAVAAKLKKFEEESGKPVYVVPGNHDFGAGENDFKINDFVETYAEFGYNEALEKVEGTGSYIANLGEKYRLIAFDSNDPNRSTGDGVSKEEIEWVCAQADKAYADGRYPILMMHHNLLDHMPVQSIFSKDFIIGNHLSVAEKFANHGIKTVFTGHEHCSDVATYTSFKGNKIYDFATTSLTMYPLQYRTVTYTEDKISYEAKTVDKIDTDALTATVSGYTQEHIDLMNAGLNDYAKGFLKTGVQYRLWLGMTPEKLGIDEDAFYADLVFTAINGLTSILEMPLYGEGSVQELAKEYNIVIPDSEFKTGWDLATELVAAHYEGEESFDIYGTEVAILLRTVALILFDDLSTVGDEIFLKAANNILAYLGTGPIMKEITKKLTATLGPVTVGEYLLLAIASPILYEFAYDSDGVNDNNGEFEGYGVEIDVLPNVADKIMNFFEKVMLYFNMFITIASKIFM
ncbi:MAG: metallophosphoesterase [Clostridia bacterium]|nr:metallophosphoesterase [Clostridia bacterium]